MVQPFAGGVMIETIGNPTIPYSNPVAIPSGHWRYEVRRCPSHQPGTIRQDRARSAPMAGYDESAPTEAARRRGGSWTPSRQGSSSG